MHLLYYSLTIALPILAASSDSDSKHPHIPCTIRSTTTGAFFDLNPVNLQPPVDGKKAAKDARRESWSARGYDYGANFTLNICGSVLEDVQDVVGVENNRWQNVSAFYEMDGKTYSIGQQNSEPVLRGRKLVLNYTDGSPCPSPSYSRDLSDYSPTKIIGDDDDDDDDGDDDDSKPPQATATSPSTPTRRKTTILSLLCTSDPLAAQMAISFVGSPDSCTYIFEARTPAACGGIEIAQQQLGPGGVFGVIAMIAVLVYLVGGCVYQRTVMHQRGWRQLPNYSLWAGIGGFFRDIVIVFTSSCTRFLPSRRGYTRVNGGVGGGDSGVGRGRGRSDSDDENRLIDQLDEEWDD